MRQKLMLVGALWGPVYFVFFIGVMAVSVLRGNGEPDDDFLIPFGVLFALHMLAIVIALLTTVFFVIDVFRNPRVGQDQRVLWLIVLLLAGVVAMPIYWWLYVRSSADTAPPTGPGAAARPEAGRGFG